MKKLLHKNFFTLVEVLIAMGICVVGLCSVVVFFPIGANASRNASMASYAATVAEQILDFAKVCIETDLGVEQDVRGTNLSNIAFRYFTSPTGLVISPTNDWKGWDPNDPSTYHETHVCKTEEPYDQVSLDYLLGKIKESDDKDPTGAAAASITPFSKGMTRYILNMLKTVTNDDFAKVTSEITPYKNNVFYARFVSRDMNKEAGNDNEDSVYSDFDCYASLWATPIAAGSGVNQYIPYAVRLHVTVSWPADLEYENRQKREFTMDVFKQY